MAQNNVSAKKRLEALGSVTEEQKKLILLGMEVGKDIAYNWLTVGEADTFTILSDLLSEAPLDIQIIINEVLKHKYKFRHVLHSMDGFIAQANEKNKNFLTDRHGLTWVPGKYYEIMPMRLGLKFTRHDHIPASHREVWCSPASYKRGLLDVPDRLVEIHDTSKFYIAGIRIKSYPYNEQVFVRCTMYGFGDRDKDKFVGDFMREGSLFWQRKHSISLQDARQAYNTTARTGENAIEERLIRRMMDVEEIQINA
jgi:hypothetical protein